MPHRFELTGCRVLIVEDEYYLADDLAKALQSHGAIVIGPVSELHEALATPHDDFDVAVIDINLHGHSAYRLADRLLHLGKPFIFTTGYVAEAIPYRFQHVPRWEKPYDVEDVVSDVADLCDEQSKIAV